MKTHYAEPSVPTLTTTSDREHSYPWGKSHMRHARFSRREWGQSLRCPRSVGCTAATNDEPPETAKATCKLLMSLLKSLSKLLTLASLNSFHSLEYMTQTLVRFMVPPATAPAAVPDGIFVRDKLKHPSLASFEYELPSALVESLQGNRLSLKNQSPTGERTKLSV